MFQETIADNLMFIHFKAPRCFDGKEVANYCPEFLPLIRFRHHKGLDRPVPYQCKLLSI